MLLTLRRILLHLLCRTSAEDAINVFTPLLTTVLRRSGALIVEWQLDIVVFKHLVHLEEEVYHLGEAYIRNGLIDNFTNLTWLNTHIEAHIYIDLELTHRVAANGACQDAHATGLFKHRLFCKLERLVESEIIEYLC